MPDPSDDQEPIPDDLSGGFDLGSLLNTAMQMQQDLMAAQDQAASQVVEGVAGGGMVRIEVTGSLDFRSVVIHPDAVDPDDVEMLQDLVLAALHDAVGRIQELPSAAMPDLSALGLGGAGLDLDTLMGGVRFGGEDLLPLEAPDPADRDGQAEP